MRRPDKVYLYAVEHPTGVRFESHDGKYIGYRAGGSEDQTQYKFILQALVKRYGGEKAIQVYEDFMHALLDVKDLNKETFSKPTGVLVLYNKEKWNDSQGNFYNNKGSHQNDEDQE